jgi:hypothetical protein
LHRTQFQKKKKDRRKKFPTQRSNRHTSQTKRKTSCGTAKNSAEGKTHENDEAAPMEKDCLVLKRASASGCGP